MASNAPMSNDLDMSAGALAHAPLQKTARGHQTAYTLDRVRNSLLYGAVCIYHTYVFFATVVIFLTLCVNLLLEWWISWFRLAGLSSGTTGIEAHLYLGVLFRSCLLIRFMSELIRTSVWLVSDVWGLPAFQLYRATLLGKPCALMLVGRDAAEVLAAPGGWRYTDKMTGRADLLIQCCIYFSLDVWPLIAVYLWGFEQLTVQGVTAASVNVFVFHLAYSMNDLVAKCGSWRHTKIVREDDASQELSERPTPRNDSLFPIPVEGYSSDLPDFDAQGSKSVGVSSKDFLDVRYSLSEEADGVRTRQLLTAAQIQTAKDADDDPDDNDETPLSLCALICGIGQTVVGTIFKVLIAVVAIGLIVQDTLMNQSPVRAVVFASMGLFVVFIVFSERIRTSITDLPCSEREIHCLHNLVPESRWELVCRLEFWCSIHCGLSAKSLGAQFAIQACGLFFQVILFTTIFWAKGVAWAAVALTFTMVRWVSLGCIKPMGGLVGLLEGIIYILLTLFLNGMVGDKFGMGLVVFLALNTQFTFSRQESYMWRTFLVCTVFLHLLLFAIVGLSVWAVVTEDTKLNEASVNALAAPRYAKALNLAEQNYAQPKYAFCSMNFPLTRLDGSGNSAETFGLMDFAKCCNLSSIDDKSKLEKQLQEWLPNWKLSEMHVTSSVDNGWTKYIVLDNPSNTATVFALRGSDSPMDVLQDLNIFSPVTITQMSGVIGPNLESTVAKAVLLFTSLFPNADKNRFHKMVHRVQERVARDPNRRYYFTGHSMGGGLAKLLALEEGHPAVAFSAPGLHHTSLSLLTSDAFAYKNAWGLNSFQTAADHLVFTVIPDNDLIPLVDKQLGTQLRVHCNANKGPYECHKLETSWVELENNCGQK